MNDEKNVPYDGPTAQEPENVPHSSGNVVEFESRDIDIPTPEINGGDYEMRDSMEESGPEMGIGNTVTSSTRDIKITPLSSGFLVRVGCQSVAVETNERLVDMLSKYVTNTKDFEDKWYSKDVRNRLENI